MPHPSSADSTLRKSFLRQLERLWPAIKGSLSEVRKPCIRPNCAACARGDKHPAFMLSFTDKGRRRCMYVPAELVPQLQQALTTARPWKHCSANWDLSSCANTASSVTPRTRNKPYEIPTDLLPRVSEKAVGHSTGYRRKLFGSKPGGATRSGRPRKAPLAPRLLRPRGRSKPMRHRKIRSAGGDAKPGHSGHGHRGIPDADVTREESVPGLKQCPYCGGPWTPRAATPAPLLKWLRCARRSSVMNWRNGTVAVVTALSPPDRLESLPKGSSATNY